MSTIEKPQRVLLFSNGEIERHTKIISFAAELAGFCCVRHVTEVCALEDLDGCASRFGALVVALRPGTVPNHRSSNSDVFEGRQLIDKATDLELPKAMISPQLALQKFVSPDTNDRLITTPSFSGMADSLEQWFTEIAPKAELL